MSADPGGRILPGSHSKFEKLHSNLVGLRARDDAVTVDVEGIEKGIGPLDRLSPHEIRLVC